jgi:ankyrin repeat protein
MVYIIDDTQSGCTALHYAVAWGHLDCIQLLVQAGALIDILNDVRTLDVHTVYRHVITHDISY